MSNARRKFVIAVSLSLLMLVVAVNQASAQTASGTITGVVRDSSGALIPEATVTITHVQQGVQYVVKTTSDGLYARRFLPVGTYIVTSEAPSFKKETKTDLVLTIGQTLSVDFSMQVGEVTQTVEVKGDATQLLKTESSEVGQVINHTQVEDLPLNGRNFADLIPLNAGVTTGLQHASNTGYNFNGSRSDENLFLLDGVDNIDSTNNLLLSPSIDAIQEFQVQTGDYSAEFGRSAGGIVQLELRSGTDRFHGSIFEFLRNDKLDANGFFNNQLPPQAGQNNAPKQPLRQNQFGGTLGGPIIKDKFFFFGDYQGTRTQRGSAETYSVPTALERQGDFSQTLAPGKPIFKNALLGTVYPGCNLANFTPATCQVIPNSALDPAALKIANLYPLPNRTGLFVPGTGTFNNFTTSGTERDTSNSFDVKLDLLATQRDSVAVHYSFQNSNNVIPAAYDNGKLGPCINCGVVIDLLAGSPQSRNQNAGVTYVRNLTPALVNEFRTGFSRSHTFYATADGGTNLADQLGIPNVNINSFTTGLPWFDFSPAPTWTGTSPFTPESSGYTVFQVTDNLSWVRGKHRVKTGIDFRRRDTNGVGNFFGKGAYIFVPFFTGNQFADFMTGRPLVIEQDLTIGTRGLRGTDLGFYVQDDYKVTPKLTLNLGIRNDVFPGWTEAANRVSNLNLTTGLVELAGVGGAPTTFGKNYHNNWAPRVGYAYQLGSSGKWVLRGGYGISYENPNEVQNYADLNAPFTEAFTLTNLSFTTFDAIVKISDGIPVQFRPTPQNFDPTKPAGNWRVIDSKEPIPYVQFYSFGIERAIGWDTVLDVSYVGSRGTHLPGELDGDPTPPGPTGNQSQRRILNNIIPSVTGVTYYTDAFTSNYNSLQVKAEKRFSHGLQFLSTYTWAKSMDNKSGSAITGGGDSNPSSLPQNSLDLAAEYGRSSFDITHRFVTSVNYNLPFGRGQRFGAGWNRVVDGFLGGWQMNSIVTLASGLPFTVFASSTASCGCSAGELRADRIANGNLPSGKRSPDGWFDKTAFTNPPSSTATMGGGRYGNAGRNIIFGPGLANVDYSLFKKFMIRERVELQFRGEYFDFFNRVNFFYPVSTGNASWVSGGLLTQAHPPRIGQVALKIIF